MTGQAGTWSNWTGNQVCSPDEIVFAGRTEDLIQVVKSARVTGRTVKVVGSGHSFSECALTTGIQVRMDNFSGLVDHDPESHRVKVQAGITVNSLNEELWDRGLALPSLGDIGYQTISGAVSTATHGTGASFRGVASQIVGIELVTGGGAVIVADAQEETEIFESARVSIGAMCIVSAVTLQCVPAFLLHVIEKPMSFDELLDRFDELAGSNEHFEAFWVPHTDLVLTKRYNRTEAPVSRRRTWRDFRGPIAVGDAASGALVRYSRAHPQRRVFTAQAVKQTVKLSTPSVYVDRSYRVFTTPRRGRFCEMEYAIDRGRAVPALRELARFVEEEGHPAEFPVEIRFAAADDIPLSMASGRDTCYIAARAAPGAEADPHLAGVEAIMAAEGGRPHWGMLHVQSATTLAEQYPGWERFQGVRRTLDPDGLFSNSYTDRVLGPLR